MTLDALSLLKESFYAEHTVISSFTIILADQASAVPTLLRADALRALRAQRRALAAMARTGEAIGQGKAEGNR